MDIGDCVRACLFSTDKFFRYGCSMNREVQEFLGKYSENANYHQRYNGLLQMREVSAFFVVQCSNMYLRMENKYIYLRMKNCNN